MSASVSIASVEPRGWPLIPLGELLLELRNGLTATQEKEPPGIPVTRIETISNGIVDMERVRYVRDLPVEKIERFRLREGDILFSHINSDLHLGKTAVVTSDRPLLHGMNLLLLRPDSLRLASRYLHHWLNHCRRSGRFMAIAQHAVNQSSLNQAKISSIEIALPPLDVQHQIVAEIEKQFSRLDEAVAGLRRVKANLKRYKAAILKAAVEGRLVETEADLTRRGGGTVAEPVRLTTGAGTPPSKKRAGRLWGSGHVPELTGDERAAPPAGWVWVKVRDLGYSPEDAVQVGPMSMKSSDFAEEGIPVLNVGCVQWGTFDETKLDHLPLSVADRFVRYRIQPGDVLFTRSGTVGRCAVAQKHQGNWLMTFHLLRARPDPRKCLPEYLRAVLEGAPHIRRQTREASVGSTRAGFNTNLLAMLDVPLPSLPEQHRIVAEVDRLLSIAREAEAEVEANLKRAELLRQTVLHRMFSNGVECLNSL